MALRIIRESDPIEITQLTVVIYSPPGTGKTSTGFSAEQPYLLDFDRGMHRSRNRRDGSAIERWQDVCEIDARDIAAYKTIVVDTAGRALDMLTADIISEEPKLGRGGSLSIQGYGVLKSRFTAWLKYMRGLGKDVVLLAHSDEQKKGDETVERLDVQGGSKSEIYKSADMMGRLFIKDGKRYLNFSPTEIAFGKNPAGFGELEVPDFALEPNYLGRLIQDAKDKINSQSDAQMAASALLEEWRTRLDESLTPEDFNRAATEVTDADCSDSQRSVIKRLIVDRASAREIAWDKTAKSFARKVA